MSIKFKLITSYLILIIFAVGVLGLLAVKSAEEAILHEVGEKSVTISEMINTTVSVRNDLLTERSNSDLSFVREEIKNYGEISVNYEEKVKVGEFSLPTLYAGKVKLSLNSRFIDKVNQSTRALCTVFLLNNNKLIRVATSLTKNNGNAIGTYEDANSEIFKKIIKEGTYCGVLTFNGETYVTKIEPLYDKNKKIIGAIAVGNNVLNSYLEEKINEINVGDTGYVYIVDSKGKILVHPEKKGMDISNEHFFKKLKELKSGNVDYTVQGTNKRAYYKYFKEWDWYIVVTTNYDDLAYSTTSIFSNLVLGGMLISIIVGIYALYMTNTFVRPILKLKSYMEVASTGDLTVHSDINGKDEIGVLSNSFNVMIAENKRLLEETVQYDKLKTEFIANISHELKTPLNIIFCTAQLFSSKNDNGDKLEGEKFDNYISTIKQNCYRLLRLVNNLIDITKIDSGFMELKLKNQNIVEVVEDITLSIAQYAEAINRTIIFDTDTEETVMAFDEEKMERIILNLISNATKFTSPGGIIEVNIESQNKCVSISVKDDGIGIPEDKLSEIFQRFKQVDSLLNRRHEGSGIGLALVKSLVEMHNGKITVRSELGKGTEFVIILPIRIIEDDSQLRENKDFINQTNVEKIQIEFSDIYH